MTFLDQDHHGSGYVINTQNWTGANSDLVLHQYSNERSAMIIDNCRSQPSIHINNTQNSSITPDIAEADKSVTKQDENIVRTADDVGKLKSQYAPE